MDELNSLNFIMQNDCSTDSDLWLLRVGAFRVNSAAANSRLLCADFQIATRNCASQQHGCLSAAKPHDRHAIRAKAKSHPRRWNGISIALSLPQSPNNFLPHQNSTRLNRHQSTDRSLSTIYAIRTVFLIITCNTIAHLNSSLVTSGESI